MTNPTDLIERLKKLNAERTPGKWVYEYFEATRTFWVSVNHPSVGSVSLAEVRPGCDEADEIGNASADALFITTLANEALPALEAQAALIAGHEMAERDNCERFEKMQAEIERLREALKPFAKLDQRGDPFCWEDDRPVFGRNDTQVTTEDFRRARQALGDSNE